MSRPARNYLTRVVSLLPSATEIFFLLSQSSKDDKRHVMLVGRSHECDYPDIPSVQSLPALTASRSSAMVHSEEIDSKVKESVAEGKSLYTLNRKKLVSLRPDIILTQDLCDVCSIDLKDVEALVKKMETKPKILSLNPLSMKDVLNDVIRVGDAIDMKEEAEIAVSNLSDRISEAERIAESNESSIKSIAFIEWLNPIFVGGHWTPELIEMAGCDHPLNEPYNKAIQLSSEEIMKIDPDALIICPCGMNLETTEREMKRLLKSQPFWSKFRAFREKNVVFVDGNQMFNRPGPRLVDAFCWLCGWIYGKDELIPENFPWKKFDEVFKKS